MARIGSVHGAARELGLTQTGVTQRIRSLERTLSSTLFTRSRRGMKLTEEGQSLLRYCESAKDLEGELLAKIQNPGKTTTARIRLTGPTSLIESRIVEQVLPVIKAFPHLLLTLAVDDLETRIEDLRTGQTQFAVVPREQVAAEMDSKLLKPERYLLVGTKKWKGRDLKEVVRTEKIIDFNLSDKMTRNYLIKYRLLEDAQAERHFVNNNTAVIRLLKEGVGYGVLLEEVVKPYFDNGTLIPLHPAGLLKEECALAWYPRPQMPPYLDALIKAIH